MTSVYRHHDPGALSAPGLAGRIDRQNWDKYNDVWQTRSSFRYYRLLELSNDGLVTASIAPAIRPRRIALVRHEVGMHESEEAFALLGELYYCANVEHLHAISVGIQSYLRQENTPLLAWPYAPHGPWHALPPEGPLDYRVRASCHIPELAGAPRATRQEAAVAKEIARVASMIRRLR